MEIKDNLELHSHYIEQLFESDNTLRARTHDMGQKVAVHTHDLHEKNKQISQLVELTRQTSEDIRKLRDDTERHRSTMQFIKELFDKPIHWFYIFLLLILIESIKGLGLPDLIKHLI